MHQIATRVPGFSLRYAQREDVATVLGFIRALATFEDELDQVTATEELLEQSLFDRHAARVLLGEYEGRPVGFALFHETFSTFLGRPGLHLVDLYIEPEVRNKGFGEAMLAHLSALAIEGKYGRLEWWVHDWNEAAIRFYARKGAQVLGNLRIYRLTGEPLKTFADES